MPTATNAQEPFVYEADGWTMRIQRAADPAAPVLLLLHGWTGDENVMWIFTRKLAGRYTLIAPRGTVAAQGGGWGWSEHVGLADYALSDFMPAAEGLMGALTGALTRLDYAPTTELNLMGFSQGAALAFVLGICYPHRVARIAALAGFLPLAADEQQQANALAGKPVYLAHGRQDAIVPIAYAYRAARQLEKSGALPQLCESDAGHKLTLDCLKGLEEFL